MAKNWTCESMNCGYYWQDEDDDFPRCHCPDDGFPAPCEAEDDFDEYDDYDDCDYANEDESVDYDYEEYEE